MLGGVCMPRGVVPRGDVCLLEGVSQHALRQTVNKMRDMCKNITLPDSKNISKLGTCKMKL